MDKENKQKSNFLFDTLKGITLGISVAIPGLSAGTIAVAEKCYDTIIDAITGLKKAFGKNLLILLPYLIGLLIGALAAFVGIQKGYKSAPFTITGIFAGLVIGSLPVACYELKKHKDSKELIIHILAFSLCLLLAAGLGIVTALTKLDLAEFMKQRVWWIYILALLSGVIGAFACVVPGISGSMSLMVIGMYFPILNTFMTTKGDYSIFNKDNGGTSYKLTGILIFLLLVIGALIGLFLASKVMKVLLSNHRVSTFYAILGLIIGSVISMFINSSIYPLYINNSIQTWDYIVGSIFFLAISIPMIVVIQIKHKKSLQTKESL